GQGDRAAGRRREDAAPEAGRGRSPGAGDRRQGSGRGDEARAALQAEGDRAAPPRGPGPQADARDGRRVRRRSAQDRVRRRGRRAMIAVLAMTVALVAEDAMPLRAAPRDSGPVQAQLYKGDWLEVRGEEPGWLKVWDHRRERPGYVRPEKVRTYPAAKESAP